MIQPTMEMSQDYYLPEYAAFPNGNYIVDEPSAASSPSPVLFNGQPRQNSLPLIHDQPILPVEQYSYSMPSDMPSAYHYPDPYQPHPPPIVEFTDLTLPQDDRRRRRSQVKDKQAISSMHMRRRAQNRASQRAFRERKEKHAQDLQRQLDELEKKHKELQESHSELDDLNKKLVAQLEALRGCTQSPNPADYDDTD